MTWKTAGMEEQPLLLLQQAGEGAVDADDDDGAATARLGPGVMAGAARTDSQGPKWLNREQMVQSRAWSMAIWARALRGRGLSFGSGVAGIVWCCR